MKWKSREQRAQEQGSRIVRRFLWWPKGINGEVRWLGRVSYRQVWGSKFWPFWENTKWVDKDTSKKETK